jgi:hypothetical protein
MTDLQLGLLVIGAAVVAGVLVYNRVQERAVGRQAQRDFAAPHADVLVEPQAKVRAETAQREPAPSAPAIDYVVQVHGVPRAVLEQHFGAKARVDEAQVALQMVSRRGAVSEAELLDFRSQVEALAAAHGAQVSAPEMRAALEGARALDRACAEVDIQIALHVTGVAAALRSAGEPFDTLPRPAGGVTLLLDVPRSADPAGAYEAMVSSARRLGGRLVDDNGNGLDERALAAIGAELQATRSRLAELGIEPGSPLALRLFA